MSSNDHPAPGQPPETPPVNGSITPPPADFQPTPAADGERPPTPPGWQTEVAVPARPIAQKPRWPNPNFWWSIPWCFLFLYVTQGPGILVASIILVVWILMAPDQFPKEALTNPNPAALLTSKPISVALGIAFFIVELLIISFSLLVIRLVVGRDWMRQLALRRPSAAHTFLALASLPALWLLGNVSYDILHKVLHVPSLSDWGVGGMEQATKISLTWPWSFAVLVIGVGAGVGEELWCRGFLGRGLVGNYGVVLGVVATSFFFGLIHMDPCQGTMAMFMGLWLHFVYLTTRSLWLPMLLHFANNSLSILAPRIPHLEFLDAQLGDIPGLVYVSALLLLGAAAYALYQSRARLAPQTPGQICLWRPAYEGVEYPPPDSGMQVVHPMPSPAALALASGSLALLAAAFVSWAQRG
jgi:membrane protease YdiL (CAAX protease family)